MSIDALIDGLVAREGNYSNHPSDRGGPTMYGVTEAVARAYGYSGDMRNMSREMAVDIYKKKYWLDVSFDKVYVIFKRVGEELLDTGVNMGPGVAGKFLQRALNLLNKQGSLYGDMTVDGIVGRMTIATLYSYRQQRGEAGEDVLLKVLDGFQLGRYADITEARPQNEDFFYGWVANRIGNV